MVSAMLEAGCDKNAKMGIPATIQLTPKWQPINYWFVCMSISPLYLLFTSKLFWVFILVDEPKRAN